MGSEECRGVSAFPRADPLCFSDLKDRVTEAYVPHWEASPSFKGVQRCSGVGWAPECKSCRGMNALPVVGWGKLPAGYRECLCSLSGRAGGPDQQQRAPAWAASYRGHTPLNYY